MEKQPNNDRVIEGLWRNAYSKRLDYELKQEQRIEELNAHVVELVERIERLEQRLENTKSAIWEAIA